MKQAHVISLFFILFALSGTSQEIRATLDKSACVIGEPIQLKLSIKTFKTDSIRYEVRKTEFPTRINQGGQLNKDGGNLEITEDFKEQRMIKDSLMLWKGSYQITAWDSGEFIIPGEEITIADSIFHFNDLRLKVHLSAPNSQIDLYDIREHFTEVPEGKISFSSLLKRYWWIVILIACIGIWLFYRRKTRNRNTVAESEMSLAERTLIALEAFERERLWEKDRLKEHFSELSYLLRSYLAARYSISLLDKTTMQTRLLLKQQGLHEETISVINRILFQSDLVKFAKSKPAEVDILKISALLKQIIAETSPIEVKHD